jgi:hypothetical protein
VIGLDGDGLVGDHARFRVEVAFAVFALAFAVTAVLLAEQHAERDRRRLLAARANAVRVGDEEATRLREELAEARAAAAAQAETPPADE